MKSAPAVSPVRRSEPKSLPEFLPTASSSDPSLRDRLDSEGMEQLKRQIIALQRISSVGILAGGICHELNNALTPILNYAKLGLRNSDPDYRERALRKILDGAERATLITRGMLGLVKPGGNLGHRETVDLVRLLDEIVRLVGKDLERSRVRLETHYAGHLFARVNPPQIQQVLINLLINARQAMPGGGLVKLRLESDPTGQQVEMSVTDRGGGISAGDLPRIFEPFFSTKSNPDDSGLGGTGLGLAVCRDIVESHHGRIRVQSRPGEGSTFTLILPSSAAPAQHAQPSQGAA